MRRALQVAVGVAAMALGFMVQIRAVFATSRQANAERYLTFEVASVKPAGPLRGVRQADGRTYFSRRPFRYTERTVTATETLSGIIQHAYSVEDWELEGPAWIHSLTYEISATMPPGTSKEDARLMLRAVLAERFGLKFHREKREIPVYALVEAKGGFKLREVTDPGPKYASMVGGTFEATGTIDDVAAAFRTFTDDNRPVLNMTGIKGVFHWKFRWNTDPTVDFQRQYSPEFWNAVERNVGLRVEKRKAARDVIVIDSVERAPTPN